MRDNSTMRIEDKVGVSYRQLHHWTRLGYVKATGGENGTRHRYSQDELRVARMIGHFVKLGFAPRLTAPVVRAFVDDGIGGAIILNPDTGKLHVTGVFADALKQANRERPRFETKAKKRRRLEEANAEESSGAGIAGGANGNGTDASAA